MPRSSETVAALASALAKAQAELVNPEKSLTATIRSGRPGEADRSFRYAPLASGLDIVRKTLGQHEIATVQTTAVDQAAGMVNLTTMLAHASGEWIASHWPVCSISDMASPQRMGTALTYARRYALFTLVGIAGEDDLDAPDLCAPAPATASGGRSQPPVAKRQERGDGLAFPPRGRGGRGRQAVTPASAPLLPPDESGTLRERLVSEVVGLQSHESATTWAREVLAAKNQLTAGDAKILEDAFERRLTALPPLDEPFVNGVPSEASIAGHRPARAVVPIVTSPSLTRRACSRLWCRGDIAIASTFATSPNNRASSAAASPLTRITCGSCSPARSAARPAMNSLSRSAASTIVWCTVWATKPHGGKTPASIRSMPPASCGRKPAWKKAASLPISPRKPLMRIRDQALLQIGPRHRIKPAPPRPPDPCSPTGSSGRRRRSSCFTPPPAPRSPIC